MLGVFGIWQHKPCFYFLTVELSVVYIFNPPVSVFAYIASKTPHY